MKTERFTLACLFFSAVGLLLLAAGMGNASVAGSISGDVPRESAVAVSEEVFVPEGPFSMGCATDNMYLLCDSDARPIHDVYVDAFYIDRTEVTNAQYRECVATGACLPPKSDASITRSDYYTNSLYNDYPVINVDWWRAVDYCQWVGKRLPTEAEWEKAARGTDVRWFPWDNEPPTCDRLNYTEGNYPEYIPCVGDTVAVGSYPENVGPYGALDMVGNVSEWVYDLYESRYYYNSPYYNPQGPESTAKMEHMMRGGSWADIYRAVTTYVRLDESEIYKYLRIGFRCARTATGPELTPTSTPTPTPTPTPLPTLTPTPIPCVRGVGRGGGKLWVSDPKHLTVLTVPRNALKSWTVLTLSLDDRLNIQGDLQGIDHFFYLTANKSYDPLGVPFEVALDFAERSGVVVDTIGLYRLDSELWITDSITVVERSSSRLVALIEDMGTYGLLGETTRMYLPVIYRDYP